MLVGFLILGAIIYVAKVTIYGNDIPQHGSVKGLNKIAEELRKSQSR